MRETTAIVVILLFFSNVAVAGESDMQSMQFVNSDVTASTNIHFDKRYCHECHTKTPVRGGNLFLRFDDIIQTCRCHGYTPDTYTHPVEIFPSPAIKAKIPPQLPLTNGKITCKTCHLIQWQCRPDRKSKRRNYIFLRVNPFLSRTAICFQCHDENQYKMFDPHNQLDASGKVIDEKCLYCHTEKPNEKTDTFNPRGGKGQGVKLVGNLSVLCFRCHYKQSKLHPINANHLKKPPVKILQNMRRSERQFGITFPLNYKGEVTCATCHNPHERGVIPLKKATAKGASEKARLRLPAVADKICLACHRRN